MIARVSATVALPLGEGGGWLPDGSRMTWLSARSGKEQDRLPVRAAEHNVIMASGDGKEEVSETCTVITTLLDHQAAPADAVRDTYLTRWSASETTFGEDKATITGAGNRTSGPVLRSAPPAWSSRKPGPGSPPPSWCAPAKPPRCAARRQPHARCAAGRRPGHRR